MGIVRNLGMDSVYKVFKPPKGVLWTPFCVGSLFSLLKLGGRFPTLNCYVITVYIFFYLN
jgi:hypothetical protein